ncbi:trypsin-like peptidase domain-containing protein [Pseudomonas sp. MWU349]|uniref:trypsin-like peptidase domain-containing protein n=1 Tax=Pseudomonas sp. MWU349 TaxID=2802572 RepID=UPI001B31C836|nr:trypsin-like peptidase domain-containing protein [Pseudomonas sp. MWU349]
MQQLKDFVNTKEFADMLEGLVHPVILSRESQDEYYSHFGVGTAFVLALEGELFVVTAQHVLNNQGASHDDLRILLRNAPLSIIFDRRSVFRDEIDPDLDSDLVILRIKKSQHESLLAAGLTCVQATDCIRTSQNELVDLFHVYGYPDEGRGYEYEEKSITADLMYVGGVLSESLVPGLNTIRIQSTRPADLNGMSGSMVIAEIHGEWKFAGLVTLGGNKEGVLSFIPADKILNYLYKMLFMEIADLVVSK